MNLLASASLYFLKEEEILQQLSHSKTLLDSISDNAPDAVDNETLFKSLANHRADFLAELFNHDLPARKHSTIASRFFLVLF